MIIKRRRIFRLDNDSCLNHLAKFTKINLRIIEGKIHVLCEHPTFDIVPELERIPTFDVSTNGTFSKVEVSYEKDMAEWLASFEKPK